MGHARGLERGVGTRAQARAPAPRPLGGLNGSPAVGAGGIPISTHALDGYQSGRPSEPAPGRRPEGSAPPYRPRLMRPLWALSLSGGPGRPS